MSPLSLLPLHFGPLHPVEQVLVLAVAFGPFVVLGVVVAVLRRRAVAEEEQEHPGTAGPAGAGVDDGGTARGRP